MYEVPGSGKHHRRPGGDGKHAKYHRPALATSDKVWAAGVLGYMVLMSQASNLARLGLTVILLGAIAWRVLHHPGDRYRNGLKTTPQEEEDFARITGELPVIEPTSVSFGKPPGFNVVVHPRGRASWTPWLIFLGSAIVAGLSEVNQHRAEQSHRMGDENDELLGIPGKWNNYQPTIPAHGTRGWGPAPEIPSYGNASLAKRQQASLMGYDRDRLSGANREKWEQYFQ